MTVNEDVTNYIAKQLKKGVVAWRRTWTSGLPVNLATGLEYRGINILTLGTSGHKSRYWLTYGETVRLGGRVRKGEMPTPTIARRWRSPLEDAAVCPENDGRIELSVPFIRWVFNVDQIEGLYSPNENAFEETSHRLEIARDIFAMMPHTPEIVHSTCAESSYCRHTDKIEMPHFCQFENADQYFTSLFRELIHAAGSSKRLNHTTCSVVDPVNLYSFDPLVAEIGASFLCGCAGIQNSYKQGETPNYVDGLVHAIQQDTSILMRCASTAQRAVDYIKNEPHPFRHLSINRRLIVLSDAKALLAPEEVERALLRHLQGDWGDLCENDWEACDEAGHEGLQHLSTFRSSNGFRFWVITEWDGSSTAVLLPYAY